MLNWSLTIVGLKFEPWSNASFSYTWTRLLKSAFSFCLYGWSGFDSVFTVCCSKLLHGTSQITAFGLEESYAEKILCKAFTAINVLPPAVGTFKQTCAARGILFL